MWIPMITLHAAAALITFGAGIYVLSLDRARRQTWLLPIFLATLVGMAVFVVAAIISHWSDLSGLTRGIYIALVVLAAYMILRGGHACLAMRNDRVEPGTYIDDIGFVLISLFAGFVIVGAIDLGGPGWLVAIVAVASILGGRHLVHRTKVRELTVVP